MHGGRPHETKIRVRYDEVDRMGVVHHPRYLVYFEVARTELLRSVGGSYRALEDSGTLLVVVEAEVQYRRPASYDDVLTVRTRLESAGPVRLEFRYEIVRDAVLVATGRTVLAAVDRAGRPKRIPESFAARVLPGKVEGGRAVQEGVESEAAP
jgi:acyl-CoA thioester hydrolase